jgi:LAO/AO transport system kinase
MDLIARLRQGDTAALARAMTLVEESGPAATDLLDAVYPGTGRARVVGVTGAAGVGKSTLAAAITGHWRSRGHTVGVVAVDPSSPFTGGAFLGDRYRMNAHATDSGVFIRSMATRGQLGGLASATASMVDLLDAAGYERVLVETVGAGQEDVDVARIAACTLLVLTPEGGDEVQALKAGLMEIGDVYVINKSDLAGVEGLEAALRAHLELSGELDRRPIVKTVACAGTGVGELVDILDELHAKTPAGVRQQRTRRLAGERIRAAYLALAGRRMERDPACRAQWENLVEAVLARRLHPDAAARRLSITLGAASGEEPA